MGIIIFTLVIFAAVGGFAVGRITRAPRRQSLELVKSRALIDSLYDQAAEHTALGDSTFAPIVLDDIRATRREING